MNTTFILTIDTSAVDPQSLMSTADDIHTTLEGDFDVVDVKPWSRPSVGLTPTSQQQNQTGLPPVSGNI